MDINTLIEKTKKQLQENASQIEQLNAMRENAIAYGNKLLGKLEAYQEMLNESEEITNDTGDKGKSEQDA